MNELEMTPQDSDFSFDELEEIVNSILWDATGKRLTDLQVQILEGIFKGKIYKDIAEGINSQEQSIKNEASELFTLLNNSGELEEEINNINWVSVLKRHKNKHQNLDNNQDGSKQGKRHKVIVINGELDQIDQAKIEAIVKILQKKGKDVSIEVVNVEKESIKITIKGTEEGLARLQELFDSGELNNLEGFEVLELRDLDETEQEKLNSSLKKAQLIEAIRKNKVNKKPDLIAADLIGADLSEADLRWAYLREADLSEAYLSEVDLSWAYLREAYLREAYLSGANLNGAYLSGAYLSGAYLIMANLSEANLSGAILRGAILRGAILKGAILSEAILIRANLSGAYLRGAILSEANLREANLSEANLSGAYLSGANLNGANLSEANLSGADLSGAYLSGAYLRRANLSEANLIGAYLSWAYLSWADLRGANLSGAYLSDLQVEGAVFGNNQGISEATKEDLILRGAIFDDFPDDPSKVKSLA